MELAQPGNQLLLGNHQVYSVLITAHAILIIRFSSKLGCKNNSITASGRFEVRPSVNYATDSLMYLSLRGVLVGNVFRVRFCFY